MTATLERDQYLEDSELEALLRACRTREHRNARRDHALFATLANTGIRPGEALALKLEDLHLTLREPWIRVRRLKARREAGRIADLPISRGLARTLVRYTRAAQLAPEARVFPMTVRNAEKRFGHYCRAAALTIPYRLYALRHTAFTRQLRQSGNLRLVQAMAGHASPSTTAIYAHVDPQQKRRLAEAAGSVI